MLLEGLTFMENVRLFDGTFNEKTAIYFYTVLHMLIQTSCTPESNAVGFHPFCYRSSRHKTFHFHENHCTLKTGSAALSVQQTKHSLHI